MTPHIRHGRAGDLDALTAIYNHYIEHTHITFHVTPCRPEERRDWFSQFCANTRYPLLVLEEGDVLGYAHATRMNPREAYETSVETTIYLAPGQEGRGYGTRLYSALIKALEHADLHRAYGLIALPNAASIALHTRLGFVKVAHLHEVGRKFGRYHDVIWMERDLRQIIPTGESVE